MGDLERGRPAVEPPVRRIVPVTAARRRRPLIGLSGILLFACMFLPAVEGCDAPVFPHEVPPFLPPYLYGAVFAGIALSRAARGLELGALALRALSAIMAIGSVVLLVLVPPVGVVEIALGGALLAIVGLAGATEARVAATGTAVGAAGVLWFGAWASSPHALLGVQLSLIGSVGLAAGSFGWLREVARVPRVDLPRAITVAPHRDDILAG
jgi:hypothetical protein